MGFGGVSREPIQLNEDSLWSGEPQFADNPEALKHLDEVRALLLLPEGGRLESSANVIEVQGADAVTLLLTSRTSATPRVANQ